MTAIDTQCPHCAYPIISADSTDLARFRRVRLHETAIGFGLNDARADDQAPGSGDPAICIKCGEISEFDENLKLIKPSPERLAQHEADPEVQYALLAWETLEPERRARGWVT